MMPPKRFSPSATRSSFSKKTPRAEQAALLLNRFARYWL